MQETSQAGPAVRPDAAPRRDRGTARRSWWIAAAAFAAVMAVLLVRNSFLFGTRLYEQADMGANSILVERARHFSLLIGNYSRTHLHHPGPAFLYVQSWGETLFWSVLHVVPTAFNGQLIAVYALNALFAALVVAVGHGWTRTLRGALATFAVVLGFGAVVPEIFSVDWMPYIYVLAYLAFLISIASVAAGRVADLPVAALTGWFCLHGHACFLLFVPGLTGCAVIALAWPRRHRLRAAAAGFFARRRGAWVTSAVISALFLVPIVMELVVHWPGYFAQYFGFTSSSEKGGPGGHTAAQIASYDLWFWWPHGHAWAVVVAYYAIAAAAVAWLCPRGPVRRLCASLLAFNTLSTVLVIVYTIVGVDLLDEHYIAYFYWTAPAVMVLIVVLAAVERLHAACTRAAAAGPAQKAQKTKAAAAVVAGCAVLAAGTAFAVAPQTTTSTDWVDPARAGLTQRATDPAMAAGVARLAALAAGRPVVLQLDHDAWPAVTGILVQAERTGVRACVADPWWSFMVMPWSVCTRAEMAGGKVFKLYPPGKAPARFPAAFRFNQATAIVAPGQPRRGPG
jgi:hypothetical protein